jgi:hypothetical protein
MGQEGLFPFVPTVPAGSVPIQSGTVEQWDSDHIPYT